MDFHLFLTPRSRVVYDALLKSSKEVQRFDPSLHAACDYLPDRATCRSVSGTSTTPISTSPQHKYPETGRPQPPRALSTPWYLASRSSQDTTVVFESRFESGNLRRAIQIDAYEYDLLLTPDTNADVGATQWFYFGMGNLRAGRSYKLNVINLTKEDSLYNYGMLPCVFSTTAYEKSGRGWHRAGAWVKYAANGIPRQTTGNKKKTFYSLTMTITATYDHDTLYLAHGYPYTVSDLWKDVERWQQDVRTRRHEADLRRKRGLGPSTDNNDDDDDDDDNDDTSAPRNYNDDDLNHTDGDDDGHGRKGGRTHIRRSPEPEVSADVPDLSVGSLCRSLGGMTLPLLTITAPEAERRSPSTRSTAARDSSMSSPHRRVRDRPAVFLSARVHPGESGASWMMRGLLGFLTGTSRAARNLRRRFVFHVIPMLNPDGVYIGNYRCSLSGQDLNRTWSATLMKDANLNTDTSASPSPVTSPKMTITAVPDVENASSSSVGVEQTATIKSSSLFPETTSMRQFVEQLICSPHSAGVEAMIDLHGHSRKPGIFMFGCGLDDCRLPPPPAAASTPSLGIGMGGLGRRDPTVVPDGLQEKLLPFLTSKLAPDLFDYDSCSFVVQKSKEGTARVVGWRELGLCNSFTVEASFLGPSVGSGVGTHYSTHQLEEMGATLGRALALYLDPNPGASGRLAPYVRELEAHLVKKTLGKMDLGSRAGRALRAAMLKRTLGQIPNPDGTFTRPATTNSFSGQVRPSGSGSGSGSGRGDDASLGFGRRSGSAREGTTMRPSTTDPTRGRTRRAGSGAATQQSPIVLSADMTALSARLRSQRPASALGTTTSARSFHAAQVSALSGAWPRTFRSAAAASVSIGEGVVGGVVGVVGGAGCHHAVPVAVRRCHRASELGLGLGWWGGVARTACDGGGR